VFAAALADRGWSRAVGIELLDELHKLAEGSLRTVDSLAAAHPDELELSPCEFLCGDGNDLIPKLVADERATATAAAAAAGSSTPSAAAAPSWTVFSYTTCMPSVGPYLCELSASLGTALPLGSRVITTDKLLVSDDFGRWTFELLAQLDAPNYNTHSSTGYVFELVAQQPHPDATARAGGGSRPSTWSPLVSRRSLVLGGTRAALLASPLAAARRALAATDGADAAQGGPRELRFASRALGLGLADVATAAGNRVFVNRVVSGSEAERSGVLAGQYVEAVGGKPLAPGARAHDVRALLAAAPRPVAVSFKGSIAPDLAVEAAAKAKGAETERFKIDRTKDPPAGCSMRSARGDTIEIHYEARLADATNRLIDSSFERGIGAPFALQLGNGDVPRALELGIYDMCIGEARRIIAPPRLAYGAGGNRVMNVPPNATIVYDVSMEAINFQADPTKRREDTGMALTPWE
jgi:hypothetical protein